MLPATSTLFSLFWSKKIEQTHLYMKIKTGDFESNEVVKRGREEEQLLIGSGGAICGGLQQPKVDFQRNKRRNLLCRILLFSACSIPKKKWVHLLPALWISSPFSTKTEDLRQREENQRAGNENRRKIWMVFYIFKTDLFDICLFY